MNDDNLPSKRLKSKHFIKKMPFAEGKNGYFDNKMPSEEGKNRYFGIKIPFLITLEEAGEMLSIAPRTVRRLSQMGKLPPLVKLGHSIRISYPDLVDYLQGGSWKGAKA